MGHSTASGRASGGTRRSLVRDNDVLNGASDLINHTMSPGQQSVRVTDVIDLGNGNARIEYSALVQVPYGRDPETGREEYGYETEYLDREASIAELRDRARRRRNAQVMADAVRNAQRNEAERRRSGQEAARNMTRSYGRGR